MAEAQQALCRRLAESEKQYHFTSRTVKGGANPEWPHARSGGCVSIAVQGSDLAELSTSAGSSNVASTPLSGNAAGKLHLGQKLVSKLHELQLFAKFGMEQKL